MRITRPKVLLVAAGVVALMALFPPFERPLSTGAKVSMGYGFIGSPPKLETFRPPADAPVNAVLLLSQIAAALVIGGLVALATPAEKPH